MTSFALDRIQYQIRTFPEKFLKISDDDLSHKSFPNKWSKKEILGHLVDSAANNHHIIIRSLSEPGILKYHPYDQNLWVKLNDYHHIPSQDILTLWIAYNKHLVHLIASISPSQLEKKLDYGGKELFNLATLINEYAEHLEHHINQIIN